MAPSWLDSLLPGLLPDRDLLLVFPSQAVADAWAQASPGRFGLGAVETDRFLGWDRYKELCLSTRRDERPADRLARTIWAADLLVRHGHKPLLQRLAGPGKPSAAFVTFFASLPPALERSAALIKAASAQGSGGTSDPALADILVLRDDYAAFMATKGLFEPAWQALGAGVRGRAALFAPELMEDFDAYEAGIRAAPDQVGLYPLPPGPGPSGPGFPGTGLPPPLLAFPNAFEEYRWTFLEIGRLLEGGLTPEDLVVSIPGIEDSWAWVEKAAAQAGIPVALKGGRALSDSPFGRLLRNLRACAQGSFSFESLKALLLDRFLTWRQAEAARDLLRFGVDYHAYASYSSEGKVLDIWEESFATVGGHGDLAAWYAKLRGSILLLNSSRSFAALKKAIFAFRRDFLDETGWDEGEIALVQRSMVELEGLARAEAELGMAGRLPNPLSLLLASLESTTYVAQSAAGGGRVAVYPYRVAALHPAQVHFVLGSSQEGVRVAYSSLPFLREDQKEALGQEDRDVSRDFLSAYAASGNSSFSYAVEAFTGWSVPHPYFSGPGSAPPVAPANFASMRDSCPLRAEAAAWRGEAPLPARLLGFQTRAFLAGAMGPGGPGLEAPRPRYDLKSTAAVGALEAIGPRIHRKDGALRLSATLLKEYLSCPFAWLLRRGLGLEEETTGVGFFDNLLAGNLAHAALRDLLAAMGELGPIQARLVPEYMAAVDKALASLLPAFEVQEGPFLRPMFAAYAPLLGDRLRRLVDALMAEPGSEAGRLELDLERPYPELGAVLQGRLDRLGILPGGACHIVDYKKRGLPAKDALISAARAEEGGQEREAQASDLGDFQIAAYRALCEAGGLEVGRASYWSIEDAKALVVLGEGGLLPADDYGPELGALDKALAVVASGIGRGDFRTAGPGSGACKDCSWKAICRTRYATE